jgi:hypothetical protein
MNMKTNKRHDGMINTEDKNLSHYILYRAGGWQGKTRFSVGPIGYK